MSIKELIEDFVLLQSNFRFVDAATFKDGVKFQCSQDDLDIFYKADTNLIKKLACSFRLSNIHLVNRKIGELASQLSKSLGFAVTVNLYITPNADSQCFVYHGDPNDTLIYQILGEKLWSFPKVNQGHCFVKDKLRADASDFNESKVIFEDELIELKRGDIISFPYNLIHKAQNLKDDISAHLTFSVNYPNHFELKNFLVSSMLKTNLAEEFNKAGDEKSIIDLLSKAPANFEESIKEYFSEFEENQLKLINEGRPY